MEQKTKQQIIEEFRIHESDTGSPEVQIALLTSDINRVTGHLKIHKKDYHGRVGLLGMVGDRARMLKYLKKVSIDRYRALVAKLGLRK